MNTPHVLTLPQYFPNTQRCSFKPHSTHQTQLWSNFYKDQSMNRGNFTPNSSHNSFKEIVLSARGLKSENNLTAPIQAIVQGKHKRNTFPRLQIEMQAPASRILPSLSNQSSINRKINFTYRSPTINSLPSLQSLA
jgi:hypothetical protein